MLKAIRNDPISEEITHDKLDELVDQLDVIFAPPELASSAAVDHARQERRAAARELVEARTAAVNAERTESLVANAFGELVPDPQRRAARDRLAQAEKRVAAAAADFEEKKEKESQEFFEAALTAVAQAGPVYVELSSLLHRSIEPLMELFQHSLRHGMRAPRLVAFAPGLYEAKRNFVSIVNQAVELAGKG
jgi:hypothetical protein